MPLNSQASSLRECLNILFQEACALSDDRDLYSLEPMLLLFSFSRSCFLSSSRIIKAHISTVHLLCLMVMVWLSQLQPSLLHSKLEEGGQTLSCPFTKTEIIRVLSKDTKSFSELAFSNRVSLIFIGKNQIILPSLTEEGLKSRETSMGRHFGAGLALQKCCNL